LLDYVRRYPFFAGEVAAWRENARFPDIFGAYENHKGPVIFFGFPGDPFEGVDAA
jgi:hypothetical protein